MNNTNTQAVVVASIKANGTTKTAPASDRWNMMPDRTSTSRTKNMTIGSNVMPITLTITAKDLGMETFPESPQWDALLSGATSGLLQHGISQKCAKQYKATWTLDEVVAMRRNDSGPSKELVKLVTPKAEKLLAACMADDAMFKKAAKNFKQWSDVPLDLKLESMLQYQILKLKADDNGL